MTNSNLLYMYVFTFYIMTEFVKTNQIVTKTEMKIKA